jgi:hypothetical protein
MSFTLPSIWRTVEQHAQRLPGSAFVEAALVPPPGIIREIRGSASACFMSKSGMTAGPLMLPTFSRRPDERRCEGIAAGRVNSCQKAEMLNTSAKPKTPIDRLEASRRRC